MYIFIENGEEDRREMTCKTETEQYLCSLPPLHCLVSVGPQSPHPQNGNDRLYLVELWGMCSAGHIVGAKEKAAMVKMMPPVQG